MWNARLDETQAWIKIAGRNINDLRYADDTTLIAESEEELKSLLMKVKEESEKAGRKFSSQKIKIMASIPITSWQTDGETLETVRDFIFLGSKITADSGCSHESKQRSFLGIRKNLDNIFFLIYFSWRLITLQYCTGNILKRKKHHFAGKGPYSQSYGFSSSHVRMIELDNMDGWA